MRGGWSSTQGGGSRLEFAGTKRRSANVEELNMLVTSAVVKAIKIKNKSNAKDTSNSENETEAEQKNFEHLNIGADGNSELVQIRKEQLSEPKLCVK